jgi:hypothetical protein
MGKRGGAGVGGVRFEKGEEAGDGEEAADGRGDKLIADGFEYEGKVCRAGVQAVLDILVSPAITAGGRARGELSGGVRPLPENLGGLLFVLRDGRSEGGTAAAGEGAKVGSKVVGGRSRAFGS